MCGIVGYIGNKNATPIILEGLEKLEYRGYDSAGIAVIEGNNIQIRRDSGKISHLSALLEKDPIEGTPGIGHTRWATHGEPSEKNAHPHVGYNGKVVLVHNGIVENYLELKDELISEGIEFKSDTDTETIVHLIETNLDAGFFPGRSRTPFAEANQRCAWHRGLINSGSRKDHSCPNWQCRRCSDWPRRRGKLYCF